MMNRRNFLETSALFAAGVGMERFLVQHKTHILSLSFDDGFKKSFYKIAAIHEEYGLKAGLNVIAMGHEKGFVHDKFISQDLLGNFDDWNKLKSRGHEIMPHSWDHKNLTQISLPEAKENLDKCFVYFENNLMGYKPKKAIYNFAYNASNETLDEHALQWVRAIRTGGWLVLQDTKYNAIPQKKVHKWKLGCWSYGPGLCDHQVEAEVQEFLARERGLAHS